MPMSAMIGISCPAGIKVEQLPGFLESAADNGFNVAELNFGNYPLIIGGEIQPDYFSYFRSLFARYPLAYTAHIMYELDFRTRMHRKAQLRVLDASIDLCAGLGMRTLTVHYDQRGTRDEEEELFLESQRLAAARAAERGITVCLENIEIERYEHALAVVRAIGSPSYRMNLDLGHLYLSTRWFGGDFLAGVRECAPYLGHMHISDNTGRFDPMRLEDFRLYKSTPVTFRMALGRGDLHLPPFWGRVPLREALELVTASGYEGVYLCEYDSSLYVPFNKGIQQRVREEVTAAASRRK